ncbi:MAG TPA: MFS transporter [Chloroflexia bacterium]|nr:MFS transporter [Chloroflexia bacterium]
MQDKKQRNQPAALDDMQELRAALSSADSNSSSTEIAEEGESQGFKRPWLVLSMLLVGVVLAALDLTVVVSILTTMMYDLDIALGDVDKGAWIVSAYLLAYTVTMPFLGRVSDVYGRRPVFLAALAIFIAGSVMVALSTNTLGLGWMIAGRVVQAIGGGAMVPVSMAVVGDIFPARRRGLALGLIGAADTAGWVIGPLYGSVMLKLLGWHTIFWINVPLGLISAVLIFFALKPQRKTVGAEPVSAGLAQKGISKFRQLDVVGFFLLSLALTGINLAFGGGKEASALSGSAFGDVEKNPLQEYQTPILIGAGVALLLFIIVELFVARRPLLNLRTFRRLPYSAANLANFMIGGALIVALVGVALFVNTTDSSNNRVNIAFDAALALVPLTMGMAIGAVLGGWFSDRIGYRLATTLGLTLAVFGFILMAKWQVNWQPPADLLKLFPGAALTGLGFGTVIAPVGTAVIDWADREDIGISAALVLILRLVGMTMGLAILLQWGLARFRDLTSGAPLDKNYDTVIRTSLARVITEMFIASAIIAAVAILPALFLRRRPESDQSEEEKRRKQELGRLL